MGELKRCLYAFLGIQSFLIGVFPFYIPVYLFVNEHSLTHVCNFIAVTGIGFCITLYFWDRGCRRIALNHLITLSFASELVLLTLFFLEKNTFFIVAAGFFNGVFNCNFWMIQRLLFLETITPQNSGKSFGNFQLFVLVVLKIAIFIGGVLLENSGFLVIYLVSAAVAILAVVTIFNSKMTVTFNTKIIDSAPLKIRQIIAFRDGLFSRSVFAVDGLFLYLESYFWVISLFLLVKESFWRLGLLVIVLTLLFGILFIVIKNSIDRLPIDNMYKCAVVLYGISWLLRSFASESLSLFSLLLLLAIITFCTSIFRLTFNKRFFDRAKLSTAHEYIFIKSYLSQFFLMLFFFVPLVVGGLKSSIVEQLSLLYIAAAFLSLVFLLYRREDEIATGS